jgi:hypothetical protein
VTPALALFPAGTHDPWILLALAHGAGQPQPVNAFRDPISSDPKHNAVCHVHVK